MSNTKNTVLDAKKKFRQCGTCSQTFGHILNREFGHPKENEERALDPLAGGISNEGHQCGMLWGTALALGTEAYQRHNIPGQAIAVAVTATQHIVESFVNRTNTVNCREITGYNLNSFFGLMGYMMKVTLQGMDNSTCFKLAEKWAPEAIEAGEKGLAETPIPLEEEPLSCASEIAKRLGASDEESVMVAGFAGGLGLSGHGCGALSAAIWMKTLAWCKENPGKTPPFFKNAKIKKIIKDFQEVTNSEMLCSKICGRRFESVSEHTQYIREGGCEKVLACLAKAPNVAEK